MEARDPPRRHAGRRARVLAGPGQLSARPRDEIAAGPVVLRRHRHSDRPELVAAVNASLAHLAPWMAWAQEPATDASIATFIADAVVDFDDGSNFNYVIVERDETAQVERVVGGCGLHRRLTEPGAVEIGYWVHVEHVRRGIARAAAVALREEAFSMGLDRVEVHCGQRNTPSALVARSAGFELVRTERRPARTPGESDREMIWRSTPRVE